MHIWHLPSCSHSPGCSCKRLPGPPHTTSLASSYLALPRHPSALASHHGQGLQGSHSCHPVPYTLRPPAGPCPALLPGCWLPARIGVASCLLKHRDELGMEANTPMNLGHRYTGALLSCIHRSTSLSTTGNQTPHAVVEITPWEGFEAVSLCDLESLMSLRISGMPMAELWD